MHELMHGLGPHNIVVELAVVRPPVKRLLDRLATVPVDIEPRLVTADELAP